MLEGIVANLLNRFLGMYVRNFDAKQLNVGIWSGDVKLKNLQLRKEALDQLKLPLNVVEGYLGQLTLQIPWSNLRGKPVRVSIEDVFLLAAPREDADYDPEEQERRAHALKMEKLDSAEMLKERNTEGMSQEEQKKSQSFTNSFITAIVDNLQVNVKNIHIRYEDSISDPGHPFALGFTLEAFDAVSTDSDWQPTFIQSTSDTAHKLASLKSLAVYWDTDANLISSGKGSQEGIGDEKFVEHLRSMIVTGDSPELGDHQFILKPVTGRAGLELDKTGKASQPKVKAKVLFDELGFVIDDDQYRDALMLIDLFHYFIRHQEYKKLQPKSRPTEDPLAWLKFAGQAVLDKIHERNRQWSWDYFKERRDDRIKYIDLFKKKKKEEKLTPEETKEMDQLEHKLSYEDLRFWRSLARNQLRKENVGVPKKPQKQTWSSWVWGSGSTKEEAADDSQMSEQQRKELYDAISFDEKKSLAEDIDRPKEYVKMQVDLSLRTGSFTLKRDPHGKGTEIARLLFDSFKTEFAKRTDSLFLNVTLDGMRLYDGTTEGSLFPQIITIKDAPPIPDEQRIVELGDTEELDIPETPDAKEPDDQMGDAKKEETKGEDDKSKVAEEQSFKKEEGSHESPSDDPFFQMAFENNPLDGSADMALNLKLKAMEIIYNPSFIVQVVNFFRPPERHMESIGALMETAGATVEGIRQQTRAGLEFALQEHKTINAQLDLHAPLIIIPDSVTEKCSICLIVDAGHAKVSSELIDKETFKEMESKQKQQLTEKEFKKLENLMYDKFKVTLESTQVLIGSSIEETKAKLDESQASSKDLHIVDRINMDFLVEICIVPKGTELTKFKISGNLPVLHASISDVKYKSLMKLIDVAIPKFNEDKEKASKPLKPSSEDVESGVNGKRPFDDRRKSSLFGKGEEDLVVEDESVSGDQGNQTDGPPDDNITSSDPEVHQKTFEFKFTVEKLQGSLYRSDPQGKKPDQLLAELVGQHFFFDFLLRPFDMSAQLGLKSLMLEDHVEQDALPEFKNIVSSENPKGSKSGDLFRLKFMKVNRDSPEFIPKYRGIAMNIHTTISAIDVVVTRRTLLTLLDFILTTFTNPDKPDSTTAEERRLSKVQSKQVKEAQKQKSEPDKINVNVKLNRIAVILNNDGIRLATLSLNTANVLVFIDDGSLKVGGSLGNFTLIDDVNQGVPEDSPLRQLLSVQGDELAHFTYETFDAKADKYPGYDASIYLRAGSLKLNFVTEPFRKLMEFGVKFGKMQAIFNAARQAALNQANQIQQSANKFHFDINIKTPIVVFPRTVVTEMTGNDSLTANLGEIYLNNKFVTLDETEKPISGNKISAGIRNTRLQSLLHYDEERSEELEMIDKVDLDFNIIYIEHAAGIRRPDIEIAGNMSDIKLKITPEQMQFLLELSKSIPAAFTMEDDDEITESVETELPDRTLKPAKAVTKQTDKGKNPERQISIQDDSDTEVWNKLDFVFKVGAIGLELLKGKEHLPIGDVKKASLSRFSLNNTHIKLKMKSDNALDSELLIKSFTIEDTRTGSPNKFREVMSLINTNVTQQFTASLSITGGDDRHLTAMLDIDSPRMFLALDYLFALKAFVDRGLKSQEPLEIEEEEAQKESEANSVTSLTRRTDTSASASESGKSDQQDSMDYSFRVSVVNGEVLLLANPAISSSEAIVLSTKQIVVAKQHAMTLQVERVGMYLRRMDRPETDQLRILDDFNIRTSLNMRSTGPKSSVTDINVDIEPLVLRLSLRDIKLVMDIFTKASAIAEEESNELTSSQPKKITAPRQGTSIVSKSRPKSTQAVSTSRGPGAKSLATSKHSRLAEVEKKSQSSDVVSREEMEINVDGVRVVLIGDKHELPMLDWSVKKFDINVRDWSTNMSADTKVDTFINVYNFSKSAWEPLIEPWNLGFHLAKEQHRDKLSVDLYSRKSLELTLTVATIAMFSKAFDMLSSDEDTLSKPRKMETPFKIRNYTGFTINTWAATNSDDSGNAAKLEDGKEVPWRFEDPATMRETLSPEGATGVLGVQLEGSGFDSINKIAVNREGEDLYNLRPKKNGIQHRLLVEVNLGLDNVKYITFRSPLLVENNTHIPIDVGVFDTEEGHILKIERIEPGDARPAPVGSAYKHSLIVRPDQGFHYTWSSQKLFWKDLLRRPTRSISCRHENDDHSPPFYFQMNAVYNKKDPLTGAYPFMRIKLHAPVEVQNLLPFDFKYTVYDENTREKWANFLRKGGVSPVHTVELTHTLMLDIDMQQSTFNKSDYAIINSLDREQFKRDKSITIKDRDGIPLKLKLNYL
jgi:vacuolar protein sorting-associated protein 13A/C